MWSMNDEFAAKRGVSIENTAKTGVYFVDEIVHIRKSGFYVVSVNFDFLLKCNQVNILEIAG